MKICLIGLTTIGGHGNVMRELSKGFCRFNHSVDLYCLGKQVEDKSHYRARYSLTKINPVNCSGLKIHRIRVIDLPLLRILHFGILIRDILQNEKFDIYHVHIASLAYLLNKKPLIVTAHTTTYGEAESIKNTKNANMVTPLYYFSFKTYGYLLEKVVYKKADIIIAVNDHIKDELKKVYKVPDNKIEVIYNGVDTNLFCPIDKIVARECFNIPRETFVVLYVGRLVERKNVDLIIEAMDRLRSNKNIMALIAGSGHMYDTLQKKIKYKSLEDRVKLLGFVNHETLPKLYNAADVFVHPSIYEGMPLTLLEAQACAVPIICTSFKGVSNVVVDDETGIILKDSSAEELAKKLEFLFNNKRILNKMKSRCLDNIYENFAIDNTVRRHLSLYEKMTADAYKN